MQTLAVVILLLASTRSISSRTAIPKKQLPAPINSKIISFRPLGIIIEWETVSSDQEPVLGYKVKLWEAQGTTTYMYKTIKGEEVLVEEMVKPELSDFEARDGKLYEYMIHGANSTKLVVNNIKPDTPYLRQILAFGPSGDGEPTSYVGMQFSNPHTTMYPTEE